MVYISHMAGHSHNALRRAHWLQAVTLHLGGTPPCMILNNVYPLLCENYNLKNNYKVPSLFLIYMTPPKIKMKMNRN